MQAWLVKIALQYGSKLLIAALALAVITATYFSWKHDIQKSEHDRVVAEFEKRDAENDRKSADLLLRKHKEIARIKQENHDKYIGAIGAYAEYGKNLDSQLAATVNKRVRNPTATANCGGNAVSGETGNTSGAGRPSEEDVQEIEIEMLKSIKACEILIEDFLIPNSVIK